ncbi:MAG: hypothetical protein WED82_01880 [Balneolales bacterium]
MYTKIAEITLEYLRETGDTSRFELILKEEDAVEDDALFPAVKDADIVIQTGSEGDDLLKALKVSQVQLRVKAEAALADRLIASDFRQFILEINDLDSGQNLFTGWMRDDFHEYDIFRGIQTINLLFTDGLKENDREEASASFRTLQEIFQSINDGAGQDIPIDFYTRLIETRQSLTDEIPKDIRASETGLLGGDGNRLQAVQQLCQQMNWQFFQYKGRLVVVDAYERAANPGAVNKYTEDGSGDYTNSEVDLLKDLDKDTVLRSPSGRGNAKIGRVVQQWALHNRISPAFSAITNLSLGNPNLSSTVRDMTGRAVAGDQYSVEFNGSISSDDVIGGTIEGTLKAGKIEIISETTGETIYYDPATEEWGTDEAFFEFMFSLGAGETDFYGFSVDLPPVPDGVFGLLRFTGRFDVELSSGVAGDLDEHFIDNFSMDIEPVEGTVVYRRWIAAQGTGRSAVFPILQGDEDPHADQSLQVREGLPWDDSINWVDSDGNGKLAEISARRKGKLLIGKKDTIKVTCRESAGIDLLSVIDFTTDSGVQRCLPVMVRRELVSGFVDVAMKPVLKADNLTETSEVSYEAEEDSGSTLPSTGGGSGGVFGGGSGNGSVEWDNVTGKPAGQIAWANVTGFDNRYFRLDNHLSEGDPSTMRGNIGLEDGSADLSIRDLEGRHAEFTGNLRADTLRTDSGKFLAPVDYQFRNAGDTGFRKISIAQATGTDHAVAAGRELTFEDNDVLTWNANGQDLTENRTWTPSIANHGDGQRGLILPTAQNIYGDKDFQGTLDVQDDTHLHGALTVELDATFTDQVGSPDFAARLTGWQMTEQGHLDARRGYFDELLTRTFISETTLSLAGTDYLTKSNATLAENVTFTPEDDRFQMEFVSGGAVEFVSGEAVEFETYEYYDLTVEEHEGLSGFAVFAHDDYLQLRTRDKYTGDGLRQINIWGRALWPDPGDEQSVMNADGTQTYKFQILNPTPPDIDPEITLRAGSVILDWGRSGDGVIERSALLDNSPYSRAFTWTDRPWKTENYTILYSLGNLGAVGDSGFGGFFRDNVLLELDGGNMRFGKNAGGADLHGIFQNADNFWYSGGRFRIGGAEGMNYDPGTGKITMGEDVEIEFTGSVDWSEVTGRPENLVALGDIPGYIENTKITSTTVEAPVISGTAGFFNGYMQAGNVRIGTGVDGSNADGIQVNSNNYWYGDGAFRIGGANGITYSGTGNITLGSNTKIQGDLEAAGGTFAGELQAVTGSFGNVDVEGTLTLPNAGITNDGAADSSIRFWAGNTFANRTDANFYVRQDGYLFSPSISDTISMPVETNASFSRNPRNADSFGTFDDNWSAYASRSSDGTSTSGEKIIKRFRFRKKPGASKVVFTFWAKREITEGSAGFSSHRAFVRLTGLGITNQEQIITASSYTRHTMVAEFASADLFNETDRIIDIEIEAEIEVASYSSGTFETELFLNNNLIQFEQSA